MSELVSRANVRLVLTNIQDDTVKRGQLDSFLLSLNMNAMNETGSCFFLFQILTLFLTQMISFLIDQYL